jgi:hypothetical protein
MAAGTVVDVAPGDSASKVPRAAGVYSLGNTPAMFKPRSVAERRAALLNGGPQ